MSKSINECIRQKRKELHLRMEDVADAIGMCRSTYSKKEKEGYFYISELSRVCDFLKMSLPHLVQGHIVSPLTFPLPETKPITFSQNTSRLDALYATEPSTLTEEEMAFFNILRSYTDEENIKKLLDYAKYLKHTEED